MGEFKLRLIYDVRMRTTNRIWRPIEVGAPLLFHFILFFWEENK